MTGARNLLIKNNMVIGINVGVLGGCTLWIDEAQQIGFKTMSCNSRNAAWHSAVMY